MKKLIATLLTLTLATTAWSSQDVKDVKDKKETKESLNQILTITGTPQGIKNIVLAYLAEHTIGAPSCKTVAFSADNKEIIALFKDGWLSFYTVDGIGKEHYWLPLKLADYICADPTCTPTEFPLFFAYTGAINEKSDLTLVIKSTDPINSISIKSRNPDDRDRLRLQKLLREECARLKAHGKEFDLISKTTTREGQRITISLDGTMIAEIVGDTIRIYPAKMHTLSTTQIGTLCRMADGENIEQDTLKALALSADDAKSFALVAQGQKRAQQAMLALQQQGNFQLQRWHLSIAVILLCLITYHLL